MGFWGLVDFETKLIERKNIKSTFISVNIKITIVARIVNKIKIVWIKEQIVKLLFHKKLRLISEIKIQSTLNKIWKSSI